MKLYATTTSERASKGQGGNEFLAIEIKDDNKQIIAIIRFMPFVDGVGDGVKFGYWFDERLIQVNPSKIPYKKAAAFFPKCSHCNSSMTELVEEWVCDNESCGWNLEKRVMDCNCGSSELAIWHSSQDCKNPFKKDCSVDCKVEHLCKGVNCKTDNPHECE